MVNEDHGRVPAQGPSLRVALSVLVAGLVVAAVYQVLAAYEVGGIGAPSDIGGGLIWLVGLLMTAIGLVLLAVNRWYARR